MKSEQHNSAAASPWAVVTCICLAIALAEAIVNAIAYDNVPFEDRLRFFVAFGFAYAGISACVCAALAVLASKMFGFKTFGVAFGVGLTWAAVAVVRGVMILDVANAGLESATHSLPKWPVALAACVGGLVIGGAAFALGRTRIGRTRHGWIAVVILLAMSAVAYVLRPTSSVLDAPALPGFMPASSASAILESDNTNVLLIVVDTLRADHTSPYGYARDTSPIMTAFAEKGVLFERCIAQATSTSPSMGALMTGKYPPTNRVFGNSDVLQDFNFTLAQLMDKHGFLTAGFCSNPACGPEYGYDQGYATFEMVADDIPADEEQGARLVNDSVFGWLDVHHDKPFYLYVHYKDPHTPYIVPPDYKQLFMNDSLAGANGHRQLEIGSSHGGLKKAAVVDGSRDQDFYISQYDSEIKFIDDCLNDLFEQLTRLDLWQNTLVILTADHGESMGEHDYYFAHGSYCYEATAHVPLIVVHPSLPQGRRVTQPVGLIDVMPTLHELFGFGGDENLQGAGLTQLMVDPSAKAPRDEQYILSSYRQGYQSHGITNDRYKFVLDVNEYWIYSDVVIERLAELWSREPFFHPYRLRVMNRELYDLSVDPTEVNNLAGTGLPIEQELEDKLWQWIDGVYAAGAVHGDVKVNRSPEMLKILENLGYIR